jgi:hypothetical protein
VKTEFTPSQKRALAVVTGLALLFGAYFLRRYFMLIVIAAIVAYLFTPLYNRLRAKINGGLATTLTVLAALATVVIPVIAVVSLATVQVSRMLIGVSDWAKTADLNALGDKAINTVNQLLGRLPFQTPTITLESLRSNLGKVAQTIGEWLLHTLSGAAGGAIGLVADIGGVLEVAQLLPHLIHVTDFFDIEFASPERVAQGGLLVPEILGGEADQPGALARAHHQHMVGAAGLDHAHGAGERPVTQVQVLGPDAERPRRSAIWCGRMQPGAIGRAPPAIA